MQRCSLKHSIFLALALILGFPTQGMCLTLDDFSSGTEKLIQHENSRIIYFPPSVSEDKKYLYLQARIELKSSIVTEPTLIYHGTYKVQCLKNNGTILPLVQVADLRQANQANSPWTYGMDKSVKSIFFGKYHGVVAQTSGFRTTDSRVDSLGQAEALILAAACSRSISERYVVRPDQF